jgi:hypothetical protein
MSQIVITEEANERVRMFRVTQDTVFRGVQLRRGEIFVADILESRLLDDLEHAPKRASNCP